MDARILVSTLAVPSSLHLVIGPYPEEDESHMVGIDGSRIFVRPVKPEDAPLFTAFFKTLSPTTIYYRFFGALKELNPEMLAHLTQIDYDREIALVSIDEESKTDNMLGIARIIGDPDARTGELAILVGDAWQGKGIGGKLTVHAKHRNHKLFQIRTIVLAVAVRDLQRRIGKIIVTENADGGCIKMKPARIHIKDANRVLRNL